MRRLSSSPTSLPTSNATHFQVQDYAKHFKCFTVDLRGAGRSSKPGGTYTTELFADDVAAFMQAAGGGTCSRHWAITRRRNGNVTAAIAPTRVKSLSLHSPCAEKTDPFLRVVVEGWRIMAQGLRQCHRPGDQGNLSMVPHP